MQVKTILTGKTFTAPLLVLVMLAASIACRFINTTSLGYGVAYYLSVIILQLLVYVIPAIFYCKIRENGEDNLASRMNMTPFSPARLGIVLFTLITLLLGSALLKISLAYMGASTSDFAGYETVVSLNETTTPMEVVYILTAFTVIPALCQEFLFRAIVFTEYRSASSTPYAIICSAVLYAFCSFAPEKFIYYFLLGIVYAFIAVITRSVLASVLIHMLYSTFYVFFESYLLHLAQSQYLTLVIFLLGSTFLLFLSMTLGEAERLYHNDGVKGVKSPDLPRYDPDSDLQQQRIERFARNILSPSFLACAVIYVIGCLLF